MDLHAHKIILMGEAIQKTHISCLSGMWENVTCLGSQDYQECLCTQSSTIGCNTQDNPLQKEKAKDSVSLAAA